MENITVKKVVGCLKKNYLNCVTMWAAFNHEAHTNK